MRDMIKFIKLFIWDLFHKTEYHEAFSRSIISINEKNDLRIYAAKSRFKQMIDERNVIKYGFIPGIYVASKTKYADEWKQCRDETGYPVSSSWIDEAGEGETLSFADLWQRCIYESANSAATVVIKRENDVLKGAFSEVGAALSHDKIVFGFGMEEYCISKHINFINCHSERDAFDRAKKYLEEKISDR